MAFPFTSKTAIIYIPPVCLSLPSFDVARPWRNPSKPTKNTIYYNMIHLAVILISQIGNFGFNRQINVHQHSHVLWVLVKQSTLNIIILFAKLKVCQFSLHSNLPNLIFDKYMHIWYHLKDHLYSCVWKTQYSGCVLK